MEQGPGVNEYFLYLFSFWCCVSCRVFRFVVGHMLRQDAQHRAIYIRGQWFAVDIDEQHWWDWWSQLLLASADMAAVEAAGLR